MAGESEQLIADYLSRLQQKTWVRKWLAILLLAVLASWCAYSIYDIFPRHHTLRISGGEILSNRHLLSRVLEEESVSHHVHLKIKPTFGSYEALKQVDEGKLDLAFIQGGLENRFPNVVHVATVLTELVHVVVRPDIKEFSDLKGKVINLGGTSGGTRLIAQKLLEFSGVAPNDYAQSNQSAEELVAEYPAYLPDAIFLISTAPSDMVEFLVRERGYQLLEIPFPKALSLHHNWAIESQLLAYTYSVKPAVPRNNMSTVGVNLHLVANRHVDDRAIYQVLDALTSPSMSVRLSAPILESQLTAPSGYPLSAGTKKFLDRKDPLLSSSNFDKLRSLIGLFLSLASMALVVYRWFKGQQTQMT
jgi:TRAP-type uncharacterized transport system substrate-binding protein